VSTQIADLKEVQAKQAGFKGGVNVRDAINALKPDQMVVGENVLLDEGGGAAKRPGCTSLGTFSATGTDRIISAYTYYRAGTTPQVLIHTNAGKLYYTTDVFANPVVWTLILSGLSTTAPFSFETFNAKCYMSNGVDDYASWDGATRTAFASAPKGKFLRLWKDAMWVSGITGFPDRAYSSNAGDAETFGVAAWVDLSKGDGDTTSALGSDGLFLIVGKLRKTQIIYDPVTFANRVVDFEKGIESHFSMVQHEGTIYFLSRRGVCKYLGDAPSDVISDLMDPIFSPQVVNLNALDKVFAYVYENRVGWALPEAGSAVPSLQLEYYPRLAGVTPFGNRGTGPFVFHRIPAGVFVRVRYGAQEKLFGDKVGANKFLWLFSDSGTDDGATFQGIAETSAFDLGSPIFTKYIRRVRLLGRGKFIMQLKRNFQTGVYKTYPVDLTASGDLWGGGDVWGGTWGPDSIIKELAIDTDVFGRFFQLRFIDAETLAGSKVVHVGSQDYSLPAGEWAIYGAILEGSQLGVRE
jgi:hypothetical protein